MIGRLFIFTILSNCVLSLPVTSSQLENEDVKVMKCIVEALADVLSRPHPMPVSQECLITLKTDDRLVTILRHHNFLKELQEIAVQGSQQRAQLQGGGCVPDHVTESPQTADDTDDRSMVDALGGPGEQSILSQKKRMGNEDEEEEKDESRSDAGSPRDSDVVEEMQVKREDEDDEEESRESHVSESDWSKDKTEKREEGEDEEEEEEERGNSDERFGPENMTKDKKGSGSDEKRHATRNLSKEEDEEKDKRSSLFSHKHQAARQEQEEEDDGGEVKRGGLKHWTKRTKGLALRKKSTVREEVPHHSKEVMDEDGEKRKRGGLKSPEEQELQMIARRAPVERKGLEDEGSGSRKSEPQEPEIESLAAIESELENVAQKLHELRRG